MAMMKGLRILNSWSNLMVKLAGKTRGVGKWRQMLNVLTEMDSAFPGARSLIHEWQRGPGVAFRSQGLEGRVLQLHPCM